jgi:peptide/nickel transport system substrate-binding protein
VTHHVTIDLSKEPTVLTKNSFFTRAVPGTALALGLVCITAACAAQTPGTGETQKEVSPGFLAVADDSLQGEGALTMQVDYDTAENDGLDPQTAEAARSWMIMGLVYEPLVKTDEKFELQPGLAKSWEQPDDTTYIFTIDTDATFSNGRALTVEDVVGSLQRLTKSQGVWAGQLGPIKSIQASGDDQVTVKLSEPYEPFLAALANTPAGILPMKEIKDGSVDLKKTMLGTGPYTVEDHKQDKSWTFQANPKWHGGSDLAVQTLKIQIVDQESTRQAALREGSADIANFVSVDSLTQLEDAKNVKVVNQTQSDIYYVFENSQKPDSPLQDEDVRFAINTAIDRKDIADIVFSGETEPTGATPSNLPDACSVKGLPSEKASPDDAKKTLEASDLSGKTLDLAVYTAEPVLGQMAQLIQQQLEEVGVDVNIEQYDTATYNEHVFTSQPGDFDLAIGWFAGYSDASMLTKWWNPEQARFNAGFTGVHDDLNKLIDTAGAETDTKARADAFTDLCASADKYSEIVPLVHRPSLLGFNTSKVSPTIQSNEGYGNFLRNIADYRLKEK